MDAFIGEIRLFPYTFSPVGWMWCDGRRVPIQQCQALYAVIGWIYGGDQSTYFNLPDLRGRVAVGMGDDPSDTFDPTIGGKGGASSVTLNTTNMPPHTHNLNGAQALATARVATPAGNLLTGLSYKPTSGAAVITLPYIADPANPPTNLAGQTLSPFVGGTNNVVQAHENRQPALVLQWAICFDQGAFPVRPD